MNLLPKTAFQVHVEKFFSSRKAGYVVIMIHDVHM